KKTLVDPTAEPMGFPSGVPGIPDSIFLPENFIFPVFDYDWGPEYDHSEASGIPANAPSLIRHGIKMKVPRVDADGNEVGEVPTVQRDALLGTYLGGTSLLGQATLAMTTDRSTQARFATPWAAWCRSSRLRRSAGERRLQSAGDGGKCNPGP